jgi:carbohydrate-binding DOMON domain-containing protein
VSFSPDDRTIVTTGTDSAMNFWDAATLVRQGPRITVPGGSSWWFAWYGSNGDVSGLAPDGTNSNNEVPFDFPAQISTWRQDACSIADSDITQAQWAQYAGDQPYHTVCSS